MTTRFREIELGSMGLEESCVGAQVMLARLAQHRARKRRIIRMLQKVRPAKLIVAAYQLKRNQMSVEQRMQIAAQQNTVADNLRLGTRIVLDMCSFERFVDIATRDGASTSVGLKKFSAKTLLADSLATQRITDLFIIARRSAGELRRDRSVLHVAHVGEEACVGPAFVNGTVQYKPAVLRLVALDECQAQHFVASARCEEHTNRNAALHAIDHLLVVVLVAPVFDRSTLRRVLKYPSAILEIERRNIGIRTVGRVMHREGEGLLARMLDAPTTRPIDARIARDGESSESMAMR